MPANSLFEVNLGQVSSNQLRGLGLLPGGLFIESYTDGITASATQTQAAATQLVSEVNRITVCATRGNGVKLPVSQPGLTIQVINHGAQPCQVYGAGLDTINDQPAATGVSQMQNSVVYYACATAGLWYAEGLGSGFNGSFQTFPSIDGLVAAGTNQATATPVPTMQNRFTTVAASTGALLPAAVAGMNITIMNAGANALTVYGAGSDLINGSATFSLAAGKTCEFLTTVGGVWHTILSA